MDGQVCLHDLSESRRILALDKLRRFDHQKFRIHAGFLVHCLVFAVALSKSDVGRDQQLDGCRVGRAALDPLYCDSRTRFKFRDRRHTECAYNDWSSVDLAGQKLPGF